MDCCLVNQLEEIFAAANLMRKMKAASNRKIRWPQIGTTDTSVVQQKKCIVSTTWGMPRPWFTAENHHHYFAKGTLLTLMEPTVTVGMGMIQSTTYIPGDHCI